MRRFAPLAAALTAVLALGLAACSDDDPTAPCPPACSDDDPTAPCPCEDGVVDVPGEVATLAEAVGLAAAGDTIRIAQGFFDGTVTVTKALVITAARRDASWPILDTTGGPLAVELTGGGTVELYGLALAGGETALAIELADAGIRAVGLYLSDATHGITVDGRGGDVDLEQVTFLDCGTVVGSGGGLRVWGGNDVRLGDALFRKQDLVLGMAASVSDSSDLFLQDVDVEDHDATGSAAIACSGDARLAMSGVRFHRGTGAMVVASGRAAALDDILLDGCGGAIFLDSEEGLLQLDGLRALACTGTVLELGPDQQVTLVGGLVSDHAGAPFVVGDGAVLSLLHGTFEDLSGGLASVLGGGQLTIARCLGVDVAAPAVVGNVTSIEMTDLWRSDQSDAWAGLEVFAGVVGNIEADPLFCDRAQGDLRLQPGTPCLLPDDSVMGALGIGCD